MIVRRRCAALIPYARNARTHSDQQVAQIAASIREFGFTNPVLIDEEDGIIAGAGRVLAAHLLGLDEVPCIGLAHLTPTQRRAYVLADNKLALNAGWDLEMLSLEIGELGEAGFDLNLTGFDEFELGELLPERTEGRTDPDDAPEPPAHPVAQPGELWVLGRHHLLCGDSTVASDVERVLGGVAPHLMVTDPPYGVNYDPAWRNRAAAQGIIGQKKASRANGSRSALTAHPIARLVGSDIAHAVPLTLIAGVGHWLLGSIDWVLLCSLVMGSLPGIFFGSHLSARVPDKVLRPVLATILVIVGVRMLRA